MLGADAPGAGDDLGVVARPAVHRGDTGMSYQAWQTQWNTAMEELVRAYRAMAGTHEQNTVTMMAR
ncbi:WXG100 family type VII secretion target, partial [Mycolicibacterium insubricum]|uniref:WXG100 family type VII secretion target n=1 Tax=Mycolicibacterium insubricum TaxID=444597 RepID=UPI0039088BEC